MLDKKDVSNIAKSYGLNEIQRNENDQISVLSWIEGFEKTEENPVLFYKMQGKYSLV